MQCEKGKRGDLKPETGNWKPEKSEGVEWKKFLWNVGDQKTAGDSGIGRGQLGCIGLG